MLLFDFQAHGESKGEYITLGYLEGEDAQAAVKLMHQKVPGEKIVVLGVSLGGAAALLAEPQLKVDGMILEMVYPSIEQAATDRLTIRFGSFGRFLMPLLIWQFRPRLGIGADKLRPIEKVSKINVPKLFIAGTEDQHTTLMEAKSLFDAAAEPKEFWPVVGAAHVDLHAFAQKHYEKRVMNFLDKVLGLPSCDKR